MSFGKERLPWQSAKGMQNMNKTRLIRVNDEILKETAQIIRGELKDPRLQSMVTVTRVNTTNDLKYSKIYVSVMGTEEEKASALVALKNSAGFIRKQIAARINLRVTPEISFIEDTSLDEGYRMGKILDSLKRRDASENSHSLKQQDTSEI
ncbi:MAG: 30S ribosome-binding factor RbfA [Clostridiales bacterium]|jgi:ribosome-binding factor A|nr:30S ribosome-binding factor RbfA [Clostridiales bacterium]